MNTAQEIDAVIKALDGGRVLDVATGPGTMLAWLAQDLASYDTLIGIDLHPLDATTLDDDHIFNRPNVDYIQMDAHALDFPDASFDTVTIGNSLHHMAEAAQVLAELWRVLKPGGRLIVQEMYRDNQTPAQMTHVRMHHWWAAVDRARGVTHNETYMRAELVALLAAVTPRQITYFDYADLDRDPHDPETRAVLLNRLDLYLARLDGLPNSAELRTQADDVRAQLDSAGFHGATALLAIAEK